MSGYNLNSIQQYQQNLFNKIDANGDGSLSQTELEQAVTNAGGTTQAADALYSELDPNNTGSVSEQQFASVLPGPPFSGEMQAQMIGYQAQGWPEFAFDRRLLDQQQFLLDHRQQFFDDGSGKRAGAKSVLADRHQWRRLDYQNRA